MPTVGPRSFNVPAVERLTAIPPLLREKYSLRHILIERIISRQCLKEGTGSRKLRESLWKKDDSELLDLYEESLANYL